MANGTVQRKSMRWHKRLGAYLLAAGLVDEDTLSKALEVQKKQTHPKTKIGKLLIEMGMTDDLNIAKTLASQLNIDFIHLKDLKISRDVLRIIPASIATSSMIVPISIRGKKLIVAMANPLEQYVIDDLRFITQLDVDIAVAPESEVRSAIDRYYINNVNSNLASSGSRNRRRLSNSPTISWPMPSSSRRVTSILSRAVPIP
jgi:type IV pilus assembly protein PilB